MQSQERKRFFEKYKHNDLVLGKYILVDKENDVNYLYVIHVQGAGLTPLLDKEGKPTITREDVK